MKQFPIILLSLALLSGGLIWLSHSRPGTSPPPVSAQTAECTPEDTQNWCQVARNPQHTGYYPATVGTNFQVKWVKAFQPDKIFPQVQAIVYHNLVLVGTQGANGQTPKVIAVNSTTGIEVWHTDLDGPVVTSVVAHNGYIYANTLKGTLYKIEAASGTIKWKIMLGKNYLGFAASPLILDNTLIVAGKDGYVYALDPQAERQLWATDTQSPILQTPAANNGKVYIGTRSRYIQALSLTDGHLVWKTTAPLNGMALNDYWPVVYSGEAFIRTTARNRSETNFFAIDENNGTVRTNFSQFNGGVMHGAAAPPCVDRDGRLFVPASNTAVIWQAGWGRLDAMTGNVIPLSTVDRIGSGNRDENMNVTCTRNLLFTYHTEEGNAQFTGAYNLDTGSWLGPIPAAHQNREMTSNTQGGGGNPVSIANGWYYHISWHELIARSTY